MQVMRTAVSGIVIGTERDGSYCFRVISVNAIDRYILKIPTIRRTLNARQLKLVAARIGGQQFEITVPRITNKELCKYTAYGSLLEISRFPLRG